MLVIECPSCDQPTALTNLAQFVSLTGVEWFEQRCGSCGGWFHVEITATPTGTASFGKRQRLRRRPA